MANFYQLFKKTFFVCAILSSSTALANTESANFDNILTTAQQKNLANHTTWQRLLYYSKGQNPQSRVINRFNPTQNQQKFFVNEQGATDPMAELSSMLQALLSTDDAKLGNDSVQCRFPARTYWLQQQLDLTLPTANCQDFTDWLNKINPKSVSLIFANEYFDNLASAFAHSFLRFDNETDNQYYLNYTPKTEKGESMAKFAYKSAISGNAGEFTINHYDKNIDDYLNKQGRDVWQYKLNLNQAQTLQLARQVYEIKEQVLPYFLLDENCASEILTLLNMLFPDKDYLINPSVMIAPSQIMRQLNADGLVASSQFIPSKISKQQTKKNHQAQIDSSNNPLNAHDLSRVHTGYVSKNQNDFMQLGYRLVYHDELDKPAGYVNTQMLTALDFAVNVGKKSELDYFTLLNIRNLKPINTARAGKSWSVDVGLKQVVDNMDNDSHLVGNMALGYGMSQAFGTPAKPSDLPPNLCYQFGTLAMQAGKGLEKGYRAGVGVDFGCSYQFNDKMRAVANISLPYWVAKDMNMWQPSIKLGTQFDMGKNRAIRITGEKMWLKDNVLDDKLVVSYLRYFE